VWSPEPSPPSVSPGLLRAGIPPSTAGFVISYQHLFSRPGQKATFGSRSGLFFTGEFSHSTKHWESSRPSLGVLPFPGLQFQVWGNPQSGRRGFFDHPFPPSVMEALGGLLPTGCPQSRCMVSPFFFFALGPDVARSRFRVPFIFSPCFFLGLLLVSSVWRLLPAFTPFVLGKF